MTTRPGYRVQITAFVPCDVEDATDRRNTIGQLNDVRTFLENRRVTGATIERFAVEMVRAEDKKPRRRLDRGWLRQRILEDPDLPVEAGNPNLDAAAAMGGMGEDGGTATKSVKICGICGVYAKPSDKKCPHCGCNEWLPFVRTCPVCHTPGGEHASNCVVCGRCGGEGKERNPTNITALIECSNCSGTGRVLRETEAKDG